MGLRTLAQIIKSLYPSRQTDSSVEYGKDTDMGQFEMLAGAYGTDTNAGRVCGP